MFKERAWLSAGFQRCITAVSVALPSRAVLEFAGLIMFWINHQDAHTVTGLRRAYLGSQRLQTPDGRSLFVGLLDIALLAAQFATAQLAPKPQGTSPSVIEM